MHHGLMVQLVIMVMVMVMVTTAFMVHQAHGGAGDHGDVDGDGDHSVHGAPGSWCRWCRLELTMEGVVAILSFTTGPRAYVTYYCCWSKSALLGQNFIFLIYCVTKPIW